MTTRGDIDPIAFEVVQNGLSSLVDNMALAVMRTAHSGVVKDAMDYSTGLCNTSGTVIAQGLTIVLHLGSFPEAVKAVIRDFQDDMNPGDVFVLNDPYLAGGIHLPDIYVIRPIFIDAKVEAYTAVVAHHTDVGGIVPGSNSTDSVEIYQEGLRLPVLKLYEAGVPNDTVLKIISANVRLPDKVLGDLEAQVSATALGEREFIELSSQHGTKALRAYTNEILDYAERLARAGISDMPDGLAEFSGYVDADNLGDVPVEVRVKLTIDGDQIDVDLAGSTAQVRGGINSPLPFSRAGVYGAIRLVLDPRIPLCDGYTRAIKVSAPEGTVVNPLLPAACGARGITGFRIMDAVMGALAQLVPDRVPADGEGGNSIISIGGTHRGEAYGYVDLIAGARGGGPAADGIEGMPHPGANIASTPIEVAEAELPIRFERYGMVRDSGGPGTFRGALSQVRSVRLLADEGILQVRSDKRKNRPFGLSGGHDGQPSSNIITREDESTEELTTMGVAGMSRGDVFEHRFASGAGWGDPLERRASAVLEDVLDERVSVEAARDFYGVVIDTGTVVIDAAATDELRVRMRKQR